MLDFRSKKAMLIYSKRLAAIGIIFSLSSRHPYRVAAWAGCKLVLNHLYHSLFKGLHSSAYSLMCRGAK